MTPKTKDHILCMANLPNLIALLVLLFETSLELREYLFSMYLDQALGNLAFYSILVLNELELKV